MPHDQPWIQFEPERWTRAYPTGAVGTVHAIAPDVYTGRISRPGAPSLALGRNFAGIAARDLACHAVDDMYTEHVAPRE